MPKLMNQSASIVATTVSNFGFSTKKTDELTSSEYTLVDIEVDVSPSTAPFRAELEKALATVIDSLAKSPHAEKLLVRVQKFDENLNEVHGFVNLADIKAGDYDLSSNGHATALFDATLCGVEAVAAYGKHLAGLDYAVNAVVFVITDGDDRGSQIARNPQKIADAVALVSQEEKLESLKSIVIGVGDEKRVQGYLDTFKTEAKLDQFVWVGQATPNAIAKLADFISRSVSSASQSLNTGGPSVNLNF